MNSVTLKGKGFAEFVPLDGISFSGLPSNKGSVLVLVDTTLTGKETSDILYIGKSKNLSKKVFGGYLAGNGGKTTKKISAQLLKEGFLRKVSVSWMLSDDPKATQKGLLDSYEKEYGKCPTWNRSKNSTIKAEQVATKKAKPRPVRKTAANPAP